MTLATLRKYYFRKDSLIERLTIDLQDYEEQVADYVDLIRILGKLEAFEVTLVRECDMGHLLQMGLSQPVKMVIKCHQLYLMQRGSEVDRSLWKELKKMPF